MSPADLSAEVKDTLEGLRAMGIKLAIGSSSKNAKKILERIGLGGYFDAISDGTNITRSKPDPEVFLLAAHMRQLIRSVVWSSRMPGQASRRRAVPGWTVLVSVMRHCAKRPVTA